MKMLIQSISQEAFFNKNKRECFLRIKGSVNVIPKLPCIHSNFQSISYIQKKNIWNVGTKSSAAWQTNSLILDFICMAYNDDCFSRGEWQNIVIFLPCFNYAIFESNLTQASWVVCGSQEPISNENEWNT